MPDTLDRKIRKIYAALGVNANIKPQITKTDKGALVEINFDQGISEADLENATTLLITNIASIKDHFKVWCENNDVSFTGDELINNNLHVAIIHDLWNIDKHAKIKEPRSGFTPKLQELHRVMVVPPKSTGGISLRVNGEDSQITTDGSLQFIITGPVVDESGKICGDFREICQSAIEAWLNLLKSAGVPIS